VFFNLFSEVEPFAAILIAHGTHVFFLGEGDSWGPKGQNLRPEAESGERFLESPHQLGGMVEHCKLPSRVLGGGPTANTRKRV